MEQFFQVGVITTTHGLKGDVKVYPTTDDIKRFERLKTVILENKNEHMNLEIENVRYFKNLVILKFKGIDDINDVEKYKGMSLLVARKDALELREGQYYLADLIDLQVLLEDGTGLGVLTEVLQTGANDVYVVKTKEDKELLIPAIKDCILEVNMETRCMKVHLLEGLEGL
jgi:16S rRNA processing protein RimM